jgi:3-dehydroquinate synthase
MVNPGATALRRTIRVLGYDVHVGPWLLDDVGRISAEAAPARTFVIITDENLRIIAAPNVIGSLRQFAPDSRLLVTAIEPGEARKTREEWARLTDWMVEHQCGRDTTVIALGGGVVGDLAGFVAATYMRGVPYVQVPTSLLAMVDASVGGKVGVDTAQGKNLVGAFHQPAAVVIDPTVLQTLPLEHRRAGLAEVFKHGLIADPAYLVEAKAAAPMLLDQRHSDWHGDWLTALVARSVEIKADVVSRDERERGLRQMLNFGHTVGHAIEAASGFTVLHGDAVAIGMTVEAALAEDLGVARPGLVAHVTMALGTAGLPVRVPATLDHDALIALMQRDKKARDARPMFALPSEVGVMAAPERGCVVPATESQIATALGRAR